jgi:hypothetical protein
VGLIWGTILSVFGLVAGIIIVAAGRVLSDDVKDWLPWTTRRLIERAVSRLPESEREKRREEWESDVNEWPGNLAKIYRAWGYLSAARAIHRIAVSSKTSQFAERVWAVLDTAIVAALLWLMFPLLLIVGLCTKLDSPGHPVISRQRCLGAHHRPFHLLKFRTSRATRVGRLIRKLRLDEIPQLVNVLRGDMSLVGPPARPASANLNSDNSIANGIKPGITGEGKTLEEYIRHKSLKLYFIILWRALVSVFTG